MFRFLSFPSGYRKRGKCRGWKKSAQQAFSIGKTKVWQVFVKDKRTPRLLAEGNLTEMAKWMEEGKGKRNKIKLLNAKDKGEHGIYRFDIFDFSSVAKRAEFLGYLIKSRSERLSLWIEIRIEPFLSTVLFEIVKRAFFNRLFFSLSFFYWRKAFDPFLKHDPKDRVANFIVISQFHYTFHTYNWIILI